MREKTVRITLSYAGLLILMGIIGYLVTGRQSVTALIPAFFGIFVLVLLFSLKGFLGPSRLPLLLIALAVIGFLATMSGIPKVVGLVAGEEIARPAAAVSQSIMAVLSLAYGLLIVLAARKQRTT